MTFELGLILGLISLGFLALFWFINQKIASLTSRELDDEKTASIVNQVFGQVTEKVVAQAKNILESDKEAIYKDNQNKRDSIEKLIKDLKNEIDERQKEIRSLEQDRNRKFGDITRSIEEHRKITEELKTTTQALSRVLSNNQVRGQWGERIIEDILKHAGLVENIHYQKQAVLGTTTVKPDITLLLPNQRKVCIDVKFPYAQIQNLSLAESKTQKAQILKQFERDLKDKIGQIEKRGYINLQEGTLDYAIMFVPNEMLFSYINQEFPHIIDEAMAKKIMIVSPFTFLIVARTVMESYRNFMIENNLRKIITHIGDFIDEWGRFTQEFDKFDDSIHKLRSAFDQIHNTRYKQMGLRIRRIEEFQKGEQFEAMSQTSLTETVEPTDD